MTLLARWSGSAAGSGQALSLQSAQEGVKAGGEALVAVAVPGVDAVRGQGGEAADGQGPEERVPIAVATVFNEGPRISHRLRGTGSG